MILYKYRALNSIEYTLDILLKERLYCSPYKDLNDPFEGQLFDAHPKIVPIFDKKLINSYRSWSYQRDV